MSKKYPKMVRLTEEVHDKLSFEAWRTKKNMSDIAGNAVMIFVDEFNSIKHLLNDSLEKLTEAEKKGDAEVRRLFTADYDTVPLEESVVYTRKAIENIKTILYEVENAMNIEEE